MDQAQARNRAAKLIPFKRSRQISAWDQPLDLVLDLEGLRKLTRPRKTAQIIKFERRRK